MNTFYAALQMVLMEAILTSNLTFKSYARKSCILYLVNYLGKNSYLLAFSTVRDLLNQTIKFLKTSSKDVRPEIWPTD